MQARIIAAASDDLTHRRRLWFVMPCGYPGGRGSRRHSRTAAGANRLGHAFEVRSELSDRRVAEDILELDLAREPEG